MAAREKPYDVVIIGSGTAGLSARREVMRATSNYVVVDPGPLGTTCARVGCMPSKIWIEVAHQFHQRHNFSKFGISGAEDLKISIPQFLEYVRSVRDRFTRSVIKDMDPWRATHFIQKKAKFIDEHTLDLGDETIRATKIIIATGSSPVIPHAWTEHSPKLRERLFTTDDFFEQKDLPKSLAVLGLGPIGLELGLAMARIGIQVQGFNRGPVIAGLTDPEIQSYVTEKITDDMALIDAGIEKVTYEKGQVCVHSGGESYHIEAALVALGRKPNLENLDVQKAGIELNKKGLPDFSPATFRIKGTSVYLAGDVNAERPILHEAADQGRIAGYNAVHEQDHCFKRRTRLAITFSTPQIALVGQTYRELTEQKVDFVVGKVSFEGQGRAIIMLEEKGLLKVYGDRKTGMILGAEMYAPGGEHLAHLLAWVIESKLTVTEVLARPFYHPVVEEGLRTALRELAKMIDGPKDDQKLELMRCEDAPAGGFAK